MGATQPKSDRIVEPKFLSREANGALFVDTFGPNGYWRIENGVWSIEPHEKARAAGVVLDQIPEVERVGKIQIVQMPSAGPTPATDAILDLVVPRITLPVSKEASRALLRAYLQVQALRQRLHVRPIVIIVGSTDSGKSKAAEILGMAWFGPNFHATKLPGREHDFWIKMSKAPFVVFDNVEDAPKWLQDSIAAYATRADFTTRAFYADNHMLTLRPDTFPVFTAMSPSWLRGDVLDRAIVFPMESRPGERLTSIDLKEFVTKYRQAFIGETIATLCRYQSVAPSPTLDDRLVEFAIVGAQLAEVVGGELEQKRFLEGFRAARVARYTLAAEMDAEIAALLAVTSDGPVESTAAEFLTIVATGSGVSAHDFTSRDAPRMGAWFASLKRRSTGIIKWTDHEKKSRGKAQRWRAERT